MPIIMEGIQKIDAGDILKQAKIAVDQNETTLSLNLKCFQAAIETFSILIDELVTGTYTRKLQDLTQRTYYAFNQKPFGNGWINWNEAGENIERLYRAFKFGDYPNRLSVLKFIVQNDTYVIDELKLSKNKSIQSVGSIVKLNKAEFHVATQTYNVIITQLKTLSGHRYDIKNFIEFHKLTVSSHLSSPNKKLQEKYQQVSSAIFKHEKFWIKHLLQVNPVTSPFLRLETIKKQRSVLFSEFELSIELGSQLKNCFPKQKTSLDKILLAALFIYLYRLNNQEKLSIGVTHPLLIQKTDKLNSVVASSVPLTLQLNDKLNFGSILKILEQEYSVLDQHGAYLKDIYVRYPELIDAYQLLPIGVILEKLSHTEKLEGSHPITFQINKNSIQLYVNKQILNENLKYILVHLFQQLKIMLEGVVNNPKQYIDHLPLLTTEEKRKILLDWNKTKTCYPKNKTISQLFEEQVEKNPENIAVIFNEKKLTYYELNEKANQLACYLRKQGVKPRELIAICIERSLEMIIGILGILKSGGAYVPIDPDLPKLRVDYIIQDTKARFVVTQLRFYKKFNKNKIALIELNKNFSNDEVNNNLPNYEKLGDLAYVIYTSGSTGRPKGVLIKQNGVVNMAFAKMKKLSITPHDKLLNFSTFSFDASVWEIFTSLLAGATLYLAKKDDILPGAILTNFLRENRITIVTLPPSVMVVTPSLKLPNLRAVISAGEKCTENLVRRWGKNRLFINAYGPTETTVCATMAVCDNNKSSYLTIGKPISNVRVYIVGNKNQLLPIGAEGELLIGGVGLADGYLNRQKLTKKQFIINPFDKKSDFLYRTGDIVRWSPDGNLEYIKRSDDQIKIRGFRIELGEIESSLMKHHDIHQAVVCVRSVDERKKLEAYFTRKKQKKYRNTFEFGKLLQDYLQKILPGYMIPTNFYEVNNFPLNFNGKTDKKALIERYNNTLKSFQSIKKPSSNTEVILLGIWKKILKIDDISVDDNFFALGGDSITAMQVVAKVNDQGFRFSAKDIFQFPTIADLAKHLKNQGVNTDAKIELEKKFALAPIQYWFFEQEFKNKEQFSQVCLLTVNLPINTQFLEKCFQKISQRYNTLNLRFKHINNTWRQFYVGSKREKIINVVDSTLHKNNLDKFIKQWTYKLQENFNLETESLLKAVILSGHSLKSAKLLIAIHHLVIDGVSWRLLLEELQMLYQRSLSSRLLEKQITQGTSYQNWIKSLLIYANSSAVKSEKAFWLTMDKYTPLPVDHKRGANLEKYAGSILIELSEYETSQLLKKAPTFYAFKPHEILIALLTKILLAWKKTDGIVIDIESHGREEFSNKLNLAKTLGWFTSIYPVYFKNIPVSIWQAIETVRQKLQKIPHNGIGYGLLRYFKRVPFSHKSEIAFNYWGQFDQIFSDNIFSFDELKLVSHPENKRSHLLNVDAVVKDKKLKIIWTYSANYHQSSTIENLAQNYLDDLRSLLSASDENQIKTATLSLSDNKFGKLVGKYDNRYLQDLQNIENIYPLSPLQKGLLFHAIYTPVSGSYVVQLVWKSRCNSNLDLSCLQQSWRSLIARHQVLRTYFIWENAIEPTQAVKKSVDFPWNIYDWLVSDEQIVESERLNTFLSEDRQAGFDLSKAPLLRVTVIRLPQHQYYLIITFHHILLDGWSLPILLNELGVFYQAFKNNQQPLLLPLVSYSHYIEWQQKQSLISAEKFWKKYLKGFLAPTELAITNENNELAQKDVPIDIAIDELTLLAGFSKQIKQFCRQTGLTLSTFFQGVWALILGQYSQENDILFGVTLTERTPDITGSDEIIGLLINTLPLRVNVKAGISAHDYFVQIQEAFTQVAHYHYTPLPELQKWSEVSNGAPLFNTILVFENYPVTEHKKQLLKFKDVKIIDPMHYSLACIVVPGSKITIKLSYDKNKTRVESIKRLKGHLQTLLTRLVNHPQQSLYPINILTLSERRQILVDWNRTETVYPTNKTVHQLFEEQVEKTPDNIALIFENHYLTYRELNNLANQLANYLYSKGIKLEDFVAVCVERSLEMVIAILGVLKAGGAYIPIDSSYPKERIHYILKDSNASLIITQKDISQNNELNLFTDKIIFLDDTETISNLPAEKLNIKIKANNLVYAIYTSGSTGNPKGVLIEHQAVTNFLNAMCLHIKPTLEDNLLAVTSISFDISGLEFYLPLIVGAKCIIASREVVTDGRKLKEAITQYQISILQATPITWKMLLEAGWEKGTLKKILCGGEALSSELAKQLLKRANNLWNVYGPTETTIWSTLNKVSNIKENEFIVPIGQPIANTQIYVLDVYHQPVPLEIIGELYIGGDGLARGYLNKPALTKEKFIPNPFSKDPNARLYRTGDLVRWLPDGSLEYINRIDDQVKLNGFRIELGEIQAQLQEHPLIKQAIVVICGDAIGKKQLVAYVIAQEKTAIEPKELRSFLQKTLPAYMIPAFFIVLDTFPITPNGKVNKQALLKLSQNQQINENYVSPVNEKEKLLAAIWTEILGVKSIGRHDNFFELGGHSLSALQVLVKIHSHFQVDLAVRALFENPTIAQLSKAIKLLQSEKTALSAATGKDKDKDKDKNKIAEHCLIPLQPNGCKSPLFLVHPVGGTVFWYVPLVKYLKRDRPVYGIQDPGIEMDDMPFESVQEMAEFYIKAIQKVQPRGPYFLGGASAGANISVEMAYQLHLMGEQVLFIGSLDGWAYYPQNLQNQELFETIMRRQYHAMQNMFSAKGINRAEILLKLQWARSKINNKYTPPFLPNKLTLFKAKEILPIFESIEAPFNHWEQYSAESIEVHKVSGNHETMFQEPNVAILGWKLDECLNNAEIAPVK